MKLNNTSYVHKVIRLFCFYLEQSTGLQMITNLDEEFEEIQFKGKLSYLVIDWKNEMYSVLSHRVTQKEADIIDDIITELTWLENGIKLENERKTPAKLTVIEGKKEEKYYNTITNSKIAWLYFLQLIKCKRSLKQKYFISKYCTKCMLCQHFRRERILSFSILFFNA